MPDPLAELRAAFPVAESWLYFNHAAVAPLSLPVARAVEAFCRDALENGSTRFQDWLDRREQARGLAARLLGARPDEVAFTTSTSQGLITVAEGLRLARKDQIVLIQGDFPANQIPWFRQERRGAEVVVVPRGPAGVTVQDILDRVTDRTRLVAVPYVFFDTGQRLDLEALGAALAPTQALFCVDAIQGLGAFPLDVERARIDFLAADSHKWMLGLEGVGLFYCRRERLADLADAPFVSWLSLQSSFTPYEPGQPLLPDARRFEYASLPTMELDAIGPCLQLLLDTGVERMAEQILSLTARLAEGLAERGWQVRRPGASSAEWSGIVQASPPRGTPHEAVDELTRRRVSVAARGGGVRFSPHAWNTHEEIDRALELLP